MNNLFVKDYVLMWGFMYMSAVPTKAREGIRFCGAGITGGFRSLNHVGTRSQTQVL